MRDWMRELGENRSAFGGLAASTLLAVIAIGLSYAVQLATVYEVEISPISAPPPPIEAGPRAAAVVVPQVLPRTAADLPQTLARPLFDAGRRPPQAAAERPAKPEPAQPPAAPLKLVGIARIGGQALVLVRTGADEPGRWLRMGEEYRGWQLKQVTRDSALVEAGGRVAELRLYPSQANVSALPEE